MVLAVLKRWGIEVDNVSRFDFKNRKFNQAASREINSVAENYDLTIVLGFLGDATEMDVIESEKKLPPISEPVFNLAGPDLSYSLKRGMHRPADIARLMRGGECWNEQQRKDRCKLLLALQGMPLPVLAAMYTVVKPLLEALSGVGGYPMDLSNRLAFGSPLSQDFADETRRALLSRPEPGMSDRHGVLWLTGVLASPAPRDRDRHWLQLAKVVRNAGEARLQVLPSEEYQVSGLIGADAMVGIEKGEGTLPAGTVVQYFLLD
jgi:hypothetical protein